MFFSSRNYLSGGRPLLYVYYTPRADDAVIKLLWPLSVPRSSSPPILGFEGESPLTCNDGYHKQHNGVDYDFPEDSRSLADTAVYAGEDGIVKEVTYDRSGLWAYNIVLEHNLPVSGKFTTVSWHVNPLVAENMFVPKGTGIDAPRSPHGHPLGLQEPHPRPEEGEEALLQPVGNIGVGKSVLRKRTERTLG
jgi:hypothetical protein